MLRMNIRTTSGRNIAIVACLILVLVLHFLYFKVGSETIIDLEISMQGHSTEPSIQQHVIVNKSEIGTKEIVPEISVAEKVTSSGEVRHIGFLKVHKAASSTLQSIFYRFGLLRNLSFVLPETSHYISKHKFSYKTVLPPLPYFITEDLEKHDNTGGKYDILCNHAIFNSDKFESLLHEDSVYIAVVREPLQLFMSSAYYYRLVWPNKYLEDLDEATFIEKLIRNPKLYEPKDISNSKTFNTMSMDFGFQFFSVSRAENISDSEFGSFVDEIDRFFHLVLIVERVYESLVLMKRRLGWNFRDILYINRNSLQSRVTEHVAMPTLSTNDQEIFRNRNRFDYMLYNRFVAKFDRKIKEEKDFTEEVRVFRQALKTVQEYCNEEDREGSLFLSETTFSREFSVSDSDCDLMVKDEIPFWKEMKVRHRELLDQTFKT